MVQDDRSCYFVVIPSGSEESFFPIIKHTRDMGFALLMRIAEKATLRFYKNLLDVQRRRDSLNPISFTSLFAAAATVLRRSLWLSRLFRKWNTAMKPSNISRLLKPGLFINPPAKEFGLTTRRLAGSHFRLRIFRS